MKIEELMSLMIQKISDEMGLRNGGSFQLNFQINFSGGRIAKVNTSVVEPLTSEEK